MGCCQACQRIEIREGEEAVHWKDGKATIVDGPAVVRPGVHGDIRKLSCVSAKEREYLVIDFHDGHTEHKLGPCSMFVNPVLHNKITAQPLMVVEAGEAMVCFRRGDLEKEKSEPASDDDKEKKKGKGKSKSGKGSRLIIRGPCFHMPTPDETQHEFVWTGRDPAHPEKKVPGGLRFTKLRLTPDQMYINVPEARTSDDALLVVKLLIFFELKDLEVMLERTHDPIADLENAATSDVVAFCAQLSFEMFFNKTDSLNNIEAYPQLVARAKSIGYEITKVVFRGYTASQRLQGMQDDAQQARTQLRLEAETEEQAQRLSDLKLAKEHDRQKKKQEMQREEVEHNNAVLRMQHEEKLLEQRQIHEAKMAEEAAANAKRIEYLNQLKELGVDINAYLVANGTRPEKLIQIAEGSARVHVHTSDN